MLTDGKQIAAARQLLGWSQTDLAEKAGVSKPSIVKMESDLYSVKHDMQESVQTAIEDNGIEFLNNNGLREATQNIKTYKGQNGFQRFYDDIYETARDIGGEICLFNGVSDLVTKWLGTEYRQVQIDRMAKIRRNFHYKIIVEEGDAVFFGSTFCTYKWFPKELFNDRTIYVYGTKVAFVTFMKDDIEVLVINQEELSQSQRLFFNLAWDYIAKDPNT